MTVGDSWVPEKMRSGRGPHKVGGSLWGRQVRSRTVAKPSPSLFSVPQASPLSRVGRAELGEGSQSHWLQVSL